MYEEEEIEQGPNNILPALKRYKWVLAGTIPALLLILVVIVLLLPPVFRSQAVVLVETQQIPQDLVQSTVTSAASEQIDIIKQRVMTRDKLLAVMKKYPYFEIAGASPLELAQKLKDFEERVKIEVASTRNGRTSAVIGFTLSFGAESPQISQAVTNDLVSLFLSENVRARTARASETSGFLRAEADKIRTELAAIEEKVADYKRENKDALPEHLKLYTDIREDTRQRASELQRSINAYNDQLNVLNAQLALYSGQSSGNAVPTETEELKAKRQEYASLLVRYKPDHPDVASLKEQIALLENGPLDEGQDAIESPAQAEIRAQIDTLKAKVKGLEHDYLQEQQKLDDMQQRIVRIPQVEREFVSIKRDYEGKQRQYDSIVAKLQSAEMAESLEEQRKAERFTLLEPPIVPISPAEPDRKKFLILAIAFSLGFPLGIVGGFGFLDKSIRDSKALEKITGIAPLAEIPLIRTAEDLERQRTRFIRSAVGGGAAFVGAVVAIHFLYLPLDALLYKAALRMGV